MYGGLLVPCEFIIYFKKKKKKSAFIIGLALLSHTKGLFLSAVQTVYLHPKSAICISFSHLRLLGRRPGHPSNFSDGWTASETEIFKKSKTHLGWPFCISFSRLKTVPRCPFKIMGNLTNLYCLSSI